MIFNNIKIPSLGYVMSKIKKVLLQNLETDYVLILEDMKKHRSTEISTHFHAHVTNIYKALTRAGLKISRNKIYFECLLLACDMETAEGASPYPYEIIERRIKIGYDYNSFLDKSKPIFDIIPILEPWRTSACNNKQLMQAVEATHRFASIIVCEKYGLSEGIILPETEDLE